MKKAFTLLEVVISVTIFLIILTVLYKVLDDTKSMNKNIGKYLQQDINTNELYKILVEDIAEAKEDTIKLQQVKDENYLITFESFNTYHNAFYTNITYLLSKENNLIRVESKNKFERNKINENFFETSYIDIVQKNVKKFQVFKKADKILFSITLKNNKRELFTTFIMGN
ncbi:PulJ/GspJ family protein [Halarcobacter mediterraneus]|uniref:PulJ/GspJ family protein n=1 Tax=Halarcobacter mediterraneus TaxID=2023153 RepID=UPI0013E971A3|nr:prepilin-type N-terminal cleavage/methylation domain-containing protein [Halarcobacter mediterraneus]